MPRKGILDIDSLLCEEDRIPVEFTNDVNGLRHLDPAGGENRDDDNDNIIIKGTKIEISLWLAKGLLRPPSKKQPIIKINIPKHYGKIMQDEIKAGAKNINFKEYSYYYYEVGLQLYNIFKSSRVPGLSENLIETIRKAFCGDRYKDLMTNSISSQYADEDAEYAQTLTCAESIIFNEGVRAGRSLMKWKGRTKAFLLPKASILGRRNSNNSIDDNAVKRAKIVA
jgi:hypothetical protein